MRIIQGVVVSAAIAAILVGCGGSGGNNSAISDAHIWGSGASGLVDGPATTALFSNPANVAVAADGTVYVADFDNDAVRAINTAGNVTTLTHVAGFQRPFGLAVTSNGRLFVQTDDNSSGTHSSTSGTVWEINRGTGVPTVIVENVGRPRGLIALPDNRIVMCDLTHSTVSILNPDTHAVALLAGQMDTPGFANGTGAAAQFDRPYGGTVMTDGSILVADQNNNRIRKITMAGVVTTFAGSGDAGSIGGPSATAEFDHPQSVVAAGNGKVYVGDNNSHLIRRIVSGQVSTQAGDGIAGFVDAGGTSAEFFGMEGIALAPNGTRLWIADGNGGDGSQPFNRVRWINVN